MPYMAMAELDRLIAEGERYSRPATGPLTASMRYRGVQEELRGARYRPA
jgi:hypothetical protein